MQVLHFYKRLERNNSFQNKQFLDWNQGSQSNTPLNMKGAQILSRSQIFGRKLKNNENSLAIFSTD